MFFSHQRRQRLRSLKKQGLDLLETKAGRHLLTHLTLRQGRFTQDQRQRLKVVTDGAIDYQDFERAIQTMFGDRLEDGNATPKYHVGRRWRSNTYWAMVETMMVELS